ncbi:MAG: Gfo/Idh/MocA family oxidoreductase [Desulfobacterales bacterium]|nr:Gfo/Idh/MocA family oxidoreductase [Desulfobacterales bacterium]
MSEIPSIAVVGSGYWGKNLIRNYYNLGSLKLICDKDEELLAKFKESYKDIETCISLSDVLSRDEIKGIVIATPAETHYTIANEAILSGKHVFVEKPLVINEQEGIDLINLAAKNKRILMVGHLLQYHPVFIQLKKLVDSGELGRINYIYSHRLNLGKIRREENILWSFAPHDISMILSLAGELPENVIAHGGNYLNKKIADVTVTHMEFASGLQAHIFVSWLHPFKEQKLVVVGDKKMAVFDDTLSWGDKLQIYAHEIKWEKNLPVPSKAEPEKIMVEQDEPLKLECKHFLDCIKNGTKPITDGAEGLNVLRVLNASQSSLDSEGKKFIQTKPSNIKSNIKEKIYFAHDTSIIDEGCEIGEGTKIWHFSHILSGSNIGKNCNIGQNVVIGPDITIGNGCKIQNNVSIYKGITLEDYVFCGPSMVFTNIYNPRAEIRKMDQVRPTVVKKGATIGANSTIICGITLGAYCFIGAGATVNKNVLSHALMVGNPAKQIGWACECGERLSDDLKCISCEKSFEKTEYGLILLP